MTGRFDIDKQTLKDLEIFSVEGGEKSIFDFFNVVSTRGGARLLDDMLAHPLSNVDEISKRSAAIEFFRQKSLSFEVSKHKADFVEHYFKVQGENSSFSTFRVIIALIKNKIKPDNDYFLIGSGVSAVVELMQRLHDFLLRIEMESDIPSAIQESLDRALSILSNPGLSLIREHGAAKHIGRFTIEKLDVIFRFSNRDDFQYLLSTIYEFDVLTSIARVSKKYNLATALLLESDEIEIVIDGVFHPLLASPVPNNISFTKQKNVLFLTGANMAGKSTFLKSVGLCIYLAHVGFPVAAKSIRISRLNGLFTTINISDNLSKGLSHFYSEVLRLKNVAEKLGSENKLLVLFDELFRGTNVKDAFDASLLIISTFAKVKDSVFVVSTHINELAGSLAALDNIEFKFFKTDMIDGVPKYNYLIRDGVTDDRFGMWIVQNEGIVELIDNSLTRGQKEN